MLYLYNVKQNKMYHLLAVLHENGHQKLCKLLYDGDLKILIDNHLYDATTSDCFDILLADMEEGKPIIFMLENYEDALEYVFQRVKELEI